MQSERTRELPKTGILLEEMKGLAKEVDETRDAEKTMKNLMIAMRRWEIELDDLGKARAFQQTVLP